MNFKSEKILLKTSIDETTAENEMRIKLMKFIEENPEMGEYIKHIRTANNMLYIILGGLISVIIGEILVIGYVLGGTI